MKINTALHMVRAVFTSSPLLNFLLSLLWNFSEVYGVASYCIAIELCVVRWPVGQLHVFHLFMQNVKRLSFDIELPEAYGVF